MNRIVVALGGNALLRHGQDPGSPAEIDNLAIAADNLAALSVGRSLIVTHGNGPQVGLLALRAEAAGGPPSTLDVLGAETDGAIGYLLEREVRSRLPGVPLVTLLTQVEVAADDPAFTHPTKPIGPFYPAEQADALRESRGWRFWEDSRGFRRLVPSPIPLRVFQLDAVRLLLEADHVVICGGGGGIPVARGEHGSFRGVDAVVDKDLLAALVAEGVGADMLLLLTDVDAVYRDFPECQDRVERATPQELRSLGLPAGSMGPKVEAAARFAERTGGVAGIGCLDDALLVLAGKAGTRVRSS